MCWKVGRKRNAPRSLPLPLVLERPLVLVLVVLVLVLVPAGRRRRKRPTIPLVRFFYVSIPLVGTYN